MIPNLEQTLIEKIHVLPPEKQAKVLEFVEEIEVEGSKNVQKNGDNSEQLEQKARLERVMRLAGMAKGRRDLSTSVDEVLAEGANIREGWSLP